MKSGWALLARDAELAWMEELLLLPSAVRYYWLNTEEERGVFSNRGELEMLLSRIGTSPAWDWVRVSTDLLGGRWAQSCGDAERGLVVEVNGPDLIAARHAPFSHRKEVGTKAWHYCATDGELHTVQVAATIQMNWIEGGTVDPAFEKRAPDSHARRD